MQFFNLFLESAANVIKIQPSTIRNYLFIYNNKDLEKFQWFLLEHIPFCKFHVFTLATKVLQWENLTAYNCKVTLDFSRKSA